MRIWFRRNLVAIICLLCLFSVPIGFGDGRISLYEVFLPVLLLVSFAFPKQVSDEGKLSSVKLVLVLYLVVGSLSTFRLLVEHGLVDGVVKWGRLCYGCSTWFALKLIIDRIPTQDIEASRMVVSRWSGFIFLLQFVIYVLGVDYFGAYQKAYIPIMGYGSRFAGGLGDSTAYAFLASIWLLYGIGWPSFRGTLSIATIGVIVTSLLFVQSRALAICVVLTLSYRFVVSAKAHRFAFAGWLLLLVLIGAVYASVTGGLGPMWEVLQTRYVVPVVDAVTGFGTWNDVGSGRIALWRLHYELWQGSELLGLGYRQLINEFGVPADNMFVTSFVELGVFSGLVAVCFWAMLLFVVVGRFGWRCIMFWLVPLVFAFTSDVFSFVNGMGLFFCGMVIIEREFSRGQDNVPVSKLKETRGAL